jgi:hypothetical protein
MATYKAIDQAGDFIKIVTYPQRIYIKEWSKREFVHLGQFSNWKELKTYLKTKGFKIKKLGNN